MKQKYEKHRTRYKAFARVFDLTGPERSVRFRSWMAGCSYRKVSREPGDSCITWLAPSISSWIQHRCTDAHLPSRGWWACYHGDFYRVKAVITGSQSIMRFHKGRDDLLRVMSDLLINVSPRSARVTSNCRRQLTFRPSPTFGRTCCVLSVVSVYTFKHSTNTAWEFVRGPTSPDFPWLCTILRHGTPIRRQVQNVLNLQST